MKREHMPCNYFPFTMLILILRNIFFSKEVDFHDGDCKEILNVQFKTTSPYVDNNYYLVEEIAEHLPSAFTQESAYRTGIYAFVVVE